MRWRSPRHVWCNQSAARSKLLRTDSQASFLICGLCDAAWLTSRCTLGAPGTTPSESLTLLRLGSILLCRGAFPGVWMLFRISRQPRHQETRRSKITDSSLFIKFPSVFFWVGHYELSPCACGVFWTEMSVPKYSVFRARRFALFFWRHWELRCVEITFHRKTSSWTKRRGCFSLSQTTNILALCLWPQGTVSSAGIFFMVELLRHGCFQFSCKLQRHSRFYFD